MELRVLDFPFLHLQLADIEPTPQLLHIADTLRMSTDLYSINVSGGCGMGQKSLSIAGYIGG